ncbi:MAG: hypothetical protein ACPGVG_13085 [Mycobacterium sp.]
MREPKQTCPAIDTVQHSLGEVADELRALADRLKSNRYIDLVSELEDLRSQNEDLRDWGQGWKDRAEELESELEEARQGADA